MMYILAAGAQLVRLVRPTIRSTNDTHAFTEHPRLVALWALLLIGVIPAVLALLVHTHAVLRSAPDGLKLTARLRRIARTTYSITPTAWDYIAFKRGECFVRIRLSDGEYVGGWADERAFAGGYPEQRDIFVASQWALDSRGRFLHKIEGTLGFYVAVTDSVLVEWLDSPPAQAEEISDPSETRENK